MAELSKARKLLTDPELFEKFSNEFNKKIVGEQKTKKTIFLLSCGIFVLNRNPVSFNLCVNSESGAGKDYILNKILDMFPKDKVIRKTRISPSALNYWHTTISDPDWTWDGKILYLQDVSENVLNSDVLKVMASEGSDVTIVIRGKAIDLRVNGKPVILTTTAAAIPSFETLRRFPMCSLDETQDQTLKVMQMKAQNACIGITTSYDNLFINALSQLQNINVKIPFAEDITKHLPTDHILMRTHFDRFLDLIKASAALHQFQRKKEGEFVIAEPADYDIARIVLQHTTSNRLALPLTKKEKQLLQICSEVGTPFTIPEIQQKIPFLSEKSLYLYFDKLREFFFDVELLTKPETNKPIRYYTYRTQKDLIIPEFKDINAEKLNDK